METPKTWPIVGRSVDVDQNTEAGRPYTTTGRDFSMVEPGSNKEIWRPISTAPPEADLELAVINSDGIHALVFPCRRNFDGWINAKSKERVDVDPTHWRRWI
jgi:hypothetical protein